MKRRNTRPFGRVQPVFLRHSRRSVVQCHPRRPAPPALRSFCPGRKTPASARLTQGRTANVKAPRMGSLSVMRHRRPLRCGGGGVVGVPRPVVTGHDFAAPARARCPGGSSSMVMQFPTGQTLTQRLQATHRRHSPQRPGPASSQSPDGWCLDRRYNSGRI